MEEEQIPREWLISELLPDRMPAERLTAASLETGAVCSLSCPFCPTGSGEISLSREFMPADRFSRLLDRLGPQLRTALLFRYGEPLLNPELPAMIRAAAGRGLEVGFSTHLSIPGFDVAAAERLIESGASNIVVSCDGVTQPAYAAYRVGGDVALVLANMKLLIEARTRLRRERPRIVWQFVVNRKNAHEAEEASRLAAGLGIPISFVDILAPLSAPEEAKRELGGEPPKTDLLNRACLGIWNEPHIHSDGTVLPCCYVSTPRFGLGNALERELDEIWNERLIVAMRRYLKSGVRPDLELPCYGCSSNPHRSGP